MAAYSDFYSTVMMGVVGKVEFKHRVRTLPLGMEIGTISDEALGLLIVENYIDRWIDMYKKSKGMLRMLTAGDKTPASWMSDVLTKYTAGSSGGQRTKGRTQKSDDNDDDSYNRKWSPQGIIRFNELRKFAKNDRAKNPGFAATWMAEERAKQQIKTKSDNVFVEDEQIVEADNDLETSGEDVARAVPGRLLDKAKNHLGIESDASTENEGD
jgi:hypothetical protein